MTTTAEDVPDEMPMVRTFIRLHGHRPTQAELRDYRRSGLLIHMQMRHRSRRRGGRTVIKL